jgi:hypothetical protein
MPLRARIVRQSWSTGRLGCAHRYGDTGHKIGNVAVLIGDQTTTSDSHADNSLRRRRAQ